MTALRDQVRDALDVCDGIGIDPGSLLASMSHTGHSEISVRARTCDDYRALCAAYKVKQAQGGRLDARGRHRTYESLTPGSVVLVHHCFAHLDCWSAS